MKLRWFLSGRVRQATDMSQHVQKMLNAQRDILSQQAVDAITASLKQLNDAINSSASDEVLGKQMEEIEKTAGKWIKPYPHSELRENVEVILVAIVVAMAIRTFFLQPFKIPTGSMQPTLYGVTLQDLRDKPDYKPPGIFATAFDMAVKGTGYQNIVAKDDGEIIAGPSMEHSLGIINVQKVLVQYKDGQRETISIRSAPDDPLDHLGYRGLPWRTTFKKGEPIFRYSETSGDHLFVDRMTYNFRHPKRGEIIVFKTKGIQTLNQDQFYIKRLIGLPNETITIGLDRHVRIDGKRLDASTPHFENVYSFNPATEPQESHYSGHVLDRRSNMTQESDELHIHPEHLVVMGDNTVNSLDSRYWGDFPEQNVIGKAWFVYWPISDRFGWGQR